MKHYEIHIEWLFKGRFHKSIKVKVVASSIRSAIGKALRDARKSGDLAGYRETVGVGRDLKITAVVLGKVAENGAEIG